MRPYTPPVGAAGTSPPSKSELLGKDATWWGSTIIAGIMLVLCFPIGLVLVWLATGWEQQTRLWVTIGAVAFWAIYVIVTLSSSSAGAVGVLP